MSKYGQKNHSSLILVSLIALSMTAVLPTRAASRTITVPDNYSTISAALRYASSGDTVYVKKGTYAESTLVISRAVTLTGNDTNNDGIGDIPYIIDGSRRDNFPLMFPFDIENNTMVLPSHETDETAHFSTSTLVLAAVTVFVAVGIASAVYVKKRRH
ncbi:MAG TPA: hypothetical protein VJL33_04540 [Candidatus Bathyarchaeia archaeon]|nr:hypothetical protein [Candidatus Bathyarchaeia archaeon]